MKNCKGGKALASGGFGCVFSPALRCKGNASRTPKNGISKLMKEKYAFKEYEEINKIRDKLKNIKNFADYFLLDDIEMCRPAKLTGFDLKNFEAKCTALPKDKITETNINKKRDELRQFLLANGVKTEIHYPVPPHMQKALKFMNSLKFPVSEEIHKTTLSLPISTFHTESDIKQIIRILNDFSVSNRS